MLAITFGLLLIGQRPPQCPTPPAGFVEPFLPAQAPAVKSEPEPEPSPIPNATAAQDAHGFTFYSLIDSAGYTHWSYDWPRLWREVEAVNQGYVAANERRLAAMREEEERWRRANQQQQQQAAQQATWAAQRQAAAVQAQARPMYYVRPLAALPVMGGAGAVCLT